MRRDLSRWYIHVKWSYLCLHDTFSFLVLLFVIFIPNQKKNIGPLLFQATIYHVWYERMSVVINKTRHPPESWPNSLSSDTRRQNKHWHASRHTRLLVSDLKSCSAGGTRFNHVLSLRSGLCSVFFFSLLMSFLYLFSCCMLFLVYINSIFNSFN